MYINQWFSGVALILVAATTAIAQDEIPVAKPVTASETPAAAATPASQDDATDNNDVPVASASKGPTTRPLSATVTLINQSVIRGTLTDTTEITMKSVVGEISIPLSEVAGVRFATQEETTTTIVMLNGDSFTGATDLQMLTVETEWGAARVNGSGVAGVMLVPNLQWSSIDGLNGKRWYLTEQNQPIAPVRSPSSTPSNIVPRSAPLGSQFRPR